MTCTACTDAKQRISHTFEADCTGCCARALARGPHFSRCQKQGRQDADYRNALHQFGMTHKQVQDAAAADRLLNRRKK